MNLSPHREVRVHRPLYAGQCLSGIIKVLLLLLMMLLLLLLMTIIMLRSVTIRGLHGPGTRRPGPARTAREYSGDIKLCINEFCGLA